MYERPMSTQNTDHSLLRIVAIVLGVIVLLPLVMMAFMMPMMGMMGGMGGMGGVLPTWGVGMMLVWLVVLLGVLYLVYRGLASRADTRPGDAAIEELRVAYARGELTDEEFEQRRTRLQSGE